jgi:hypothetical protein
MSSVQQNSKMASIDHLLKLVQYLNIVTFNKYLLRGIQEKINVEAYLEFH